MPQPEGTRLDRQAERLSAKLAESQTRKSFLGRLGAAALAVVGGSAVAAAVKPDEADAFHLGFGGAISDRDERWLLLAVVAAKSRAPATRNIAAILRSNLQVDEARTPSDLRSVSGRLS